MTLDRGRRTTADSARRVKFQLSGLVVLIVLAAGGLYLARGVLSARLSGSAPGLPADVAVAVPPAVVTVPPRELIAGQASSKSTRATGSMTGTASSQPAASAPISAGNVSAGTAQASTAQASTAQASAPAGQDGTAAAQVLALINQARAAAGLPALTETAGLEASSAAHNSRMAGGCGLSHQCPGEAALGARETAAGVLWTAAGENIGEGGPVADTAAAIAKMAVSLTQSMINEQPPNDGHRMNILSSSFTYIGITVQRDGTGTVWLTQDFSN